jgi:hypothetical protein
MTIECRSWSSTVDGNIPVKGVIPTIIAKFKSFSHSLTPDEVVPSRAGTRLLTMCLTSKGSWTLR